MSTFDRVIAARNSDFFDLAPAWARKVILRAKLHGDEPYPAYAVNLVNAALAEVSSVNQRMKRQEEKVAKLPRPYVGGRHKIHGRKTKKSA